MPIPSRVPQNTQYTIRYFTTALQIYFSNVSAQKYRYFKLSLIYYRDVILLPSPGEEISFMHYFYLQPMYCKESARARSQCYHEHLRSCHTPKFSKWPFWSIFRNFPCFLLHAFCAITSQLRTARVIIFKD